jgi:hypothetical protein
MIKQTAASTHDSVFLAWEVDGRLCYQRRKTFKARLKEPVSWFRELVDVSVNSGHNIIPAFFNDRVSLDLIIFRERVERRYLYIDSLRFRNCDRANVIWTVVHRHEPPKGHCCAERFQIHGESNNTHYEYPLRIHAG